MTVADGLTPYQRKSLRGLRGIGAGILVLEALVISLAIPVVLNQGHGGRAWRHLAVVAISVVAVLLIVAGAELRRSWGPRFATALQVLALIVGASSFALLFLAVIFAAMWGGWLGMLRTLNREHATHQDAQPGG